MSQFELLRDRAYWPLFGAQLFGVFTHYTLIASALITVSGDAPSHGRALALTLIGCGIVFFISALAGPVVGKLYTGRSRSEIARFVKSSELSVALFGVFCFQHSPALCFILLVLLGVQSALSEIGRFSLLPELTAKEDLLAANALLAFSGFLSAFFGVGLGWLCLQGLTNQEIASYIALGSAALGLIFAFTFSDSGAQSPPESEPVGSISLSERAVLLPSLGVAWFWFFSVAVGLCVSAQVSALPQAEAGTALFGFLIFCLGAALGAFLCERLSQGRLELGIVPFGSIGLTVFLLDLTLARAEFGAGPWETARIILDVTALGAFASVFVVPLRALIQQATGRGQRPRLLGQSHALNSLFAALALLLFGLVLQTQPTWLLFLVLLLSNAAVAIYIYRLLPEFLLRFVLWCVSRVMYRARILGLEFLPARGACVIACNHVSFVDWMIVGAACPRPVRFVMYHRYFRLPLIGFLLREAQVIPIAPAHEDAGILDEAFEKIAENLSAGHIVCIFPEGKLTSDGNLNKFRTGIERVIARTPVPTIPMALDGLWGSFFSRKDGQQFQRPFRRVWSKVHVVIGPPIAPQDLTVARLERSIAGLGGFPLPKD